MAFETGPSNQEFKSRSVTQAGGGKNKTRRISATTTIQDLTIPPRVNGIMLKHASGASVQITMNSALPLSWVIDAGDAPISFPVTNNVDFKYRVLGGAGSVGELYCIFY